MEAIVKDIMRKRFASLKKTDSLAKAIGVFVKNPDMVFPVVDGRGKIIGEVNQHELLNLAVSAKYVGGERVLGPEGIKNVMRREGKTVADLMKTNDIKVKPETTVEHAARIMLGTEVRTLQVVDDKNKPLGFVSELDILLYLKDKLKKK
jgi:CBS domain-containing protein